MRIPPADGIEAWNRWLAALENPQGRATADVALAVRYTLQALAQEVPGSSVEVRVIPYGAVQIVEGVGHRRGTPPAVIEMDADTWLRLASGLMTWSEALDGGRVDASGERADLAPYLPLR